AEIGLYDTVQAVFTPRQHRGSKRRATRVQHGSPLGPLPRPSGLSGLRTFRTRRTIGAPPLSSPAPLASPRRAVRPPSARQAGGAPICPTWTDGTDGGARRHEEAPGRAVPAGGAFTVVNGLRRPARSSPCG